MMKNKVFRSVDFRGRIVIPKRTRGDMSIMAYDRMEIVVVDDGILIKKPKSYAHSYEPLKRERTET
jgi:AbrB family looped-hinge helix DNA binding protein